MKAFIYTRKSSESEERQAMSLDAQVYELTQIAERENIEVVHIYRESMSAKTFGRPLFNEMVQRISNGEVDTVLCWKTDRLSRNPTDSAIIQTLLQQGLIQRIITFDRTYHSNDNVLIFGIEQLMANQYIRELSANVKRGIREKLRRGEWPSVAPYGYRNDKKTKNLIIKPKEAERIVKAYELYATGRYSFSQIAKELDFDKSQIERMLSRTLYYGMMESNGELYPGTYKPIISKELFDKVQTIKQGVTVTHPRAQKLFFPFRGLMKCAECGCQLTATKKKGLYDYYYCTNGKGFCSQYKNYLTASQVEDMISGALEKISFDEELIDIMYQAALQKLENGSYSSQKVIDELTSRIHQTKQQEQRLLQTYTRGLIDEDLFTEQAQEIAATKKDLEAKLKNYSQNASTHLRTLELTKEVFLDSNKAISRFKSSNPEKKKKLASNLLWNFEVKDKTVANYSFRTPYDVLANAPKNGDLDTMLGYKDSNLDTQDQNLMSYH
jgi:site-specific DNA recombinase